MDMRGPNNDRYPQLGGFGARYSPFGGGGGGAKPAPAPAPVPKKVEVDVAAAEKEERDLAAKRRGRSRSILTRDLDFGTANTSKSELLGL